MKLIFLFFILLTSYNTHAHKLVTEMIDQIPQYQLNYTSGPIYEFTLNVTELDLRISKRQHREQLIQNLALQQNSSSIDPLDEVCTPYQLLLKTCGEFDHFGEVRTTAVEMCDNLFDDLAGSGSNVVAMVPEFTGPASFVNNSIGKAVRYHHSNYNISQGITFNCIEVIYTPDSE